MKKFSVLLGFILCASLYAGELPTEAHGLPVPYIEPYILLGESGQSIDITARKMIGQFFMRNIEVLGKYSPAGDPDRHVLVVTHPELQQAIRLDRPASALASVVRIGITVEGQMTYVSCQNPNYWANAFLKETYLEYAESFARFKGYLIKALPKMRGSFHRGFGGRQGDGLTAEEIRQYRYSNRSDGLEDMIILAQFETYQQATETLSQSMDASTAIEKVFDLEYPSQELKLIGIALKNPQLEQRIFDQLDNDKLKHTACLPLEVLIVGNQVRMLSPRYRLPLSFPDLDRKSFRQLKKLQQELIQNLSALTD